MSKAILSQLVYMGMGAIFFLVQAIKINLAGFLIKEMRVKGIKHKLLTFVDLVVIFIATTLAWPVLWIIWANEKED